MRLSDQTYEKIKKMVSYFLEDYDVRRLPIDVFEIAKKMKIKVVFASKLLKKFPEKINEYVIFSYPDSYLLYDPNSQQFAIYIDDIGTKKKRQRFSLAHELMHIILGHKEQNARNEAEANFGATYLLAPTSLALMKDAGDLFVNIRMVADIFDVSISEAEIIVRYCSNRIRFADANEKDYEKTINNLLGDSLIEKISAYHW